MPAPRSIKNFRHYANIPPINQPVNCPPCNLSPSPHHCSIKNFRHYANIEWAAHQGPYSASPRRTAMKDEAEEADARFSQEASR